MRPRHKFEGFTFVELLVALIVASIILAAVATLAYTLGAVNDSTNDMAEKQAQVRFATMRISELIRHCKLICGTTPNNGLAIWREDVNDFGQINIDELVYIERGTNKDFLRLCEFPSSDTTRVNLSDIGTLASSSYSVTNVLLIPQCSNVEFQFDTTPPTRSQFVSISFDLVENGVTRQYQISAALRGWAGNLLNEAGAVVSDDD
jgi:prepilin-type N-terminal cleavage/methylation domain-containing protein